MGDDKPTGWDRLPDRERQADFRAVLTRVMVQPQQHRGQRTGDRLVAVWCTG